MAYGKIRDIMYDEEGNRLIPRKDWHHVDKQGRKIGWMWPEDFEAVLFSLYGTSWAKDFADYSGLNKGTVYSYRAGRKAIPKHIALLVELMQHWHRSELPKKWGKKNYLPKIEAPWLPEGRTVNRVTLDKLKFSR